MKVFVCRHCNKPHSSTSEPSAPRLMTFNGLISHTKEKYVYPPSSLHLSMTFVDLPPAFQASHLVASG